ncbi:MAG: branched-chain alpha-keto acid dehydrogenase subunit E2 [Gordonia sp.]|nr:branched-chain alpha-keto acid dehydrogenase subunit E2 [Gordonia sp. (in: high G+C Gram-positive bacteria)]
MATITKFKLPDVGEGLEDAEITSWHVAVGDIVEINQTLCEIETAKSAVELPSPVAGVIDTLHVAEGETAEVGTVIVSFRLGGTAAPKTDAPKTDASRAAAPKAAPAQPVKAVASVTQPPRAATEPDKTPTAEATDEDAAEDADEPEVKVLVGTGPTKRAARRKHLTPRAEIAATVDRAQARNGSSALSSPMRATTAVNGSVPSETRVPIKGVRKAVATAMTTSAFTAPHVTEWLAVDVTETMDLVRTLKNNPRWQGVRVNPLLLVARALLLAVKRHPDVNASWDQANQEIVYHNHVNLGIAAATPRGLVVPNIKGADQLDLPALAGAISDLVETARAGKATPAQMSRGTITITNIGALGVDAGTPILNPGEAAILAFGAVRPMPWVVDGEIAIRQVTQLALSFDHRLVDGELGSNVLTETASVLTHPVQALLHS